MLPVLSDPPRLALRRRHVRLERVGRNRFGVLLDRCRLCPRTAGERQNRESSDQIQSAHKQASSGAKVGAAPLVGREYPFAPRESNVFRAREGNSPQPELSHKLRRKCAYSTTITTVSQPNAISTVPPACASSHAAGHSQ